MPCKPDIKKKSRRVSIYLNGARKIGEELNKLKAKQPRKINRKNNQITGVDNLVHSHASSTKKVHHHHRKMSQDSIPVTSRIKKPRRHSDLGGICSASNDNEDTYAGKSIFERNSNSVASSRESSASLSNRSQRSRKISIGSHGGGAGKIPWCACWGNGCL